MVNTEAIQIDQFLSTKSTTLQMADAAIRMPDISPREVSQVFAQYIPVHP